MAIKFDELLKALDPSLDKYTYESLSEDCEKELKEDLNNIDSINKKIIANCDPESVLIEVLNACGGNLTWAASDLGLTLDELKNAIKFYKLDQDFDSLYESLNEDFWDPGKEFNEFTSLLNTEFDNSGWNNWDQAHRDKFAEKVAKRYLELNPTPTPMFFQDLTDNNYHTVRRAFERLLNKSSLTESSDEEEFPDEAFTVIVTTYYNDHGKRKAETESFGPYSEEEAKEVANSTVGDEIKIFKLHQYGRK